MSAARSHLAVESLPENSEKTRIFRLEFGRPLVRIGRDFIAAPTRFAEDKLRECRLAMRLGGFFNIGMTKAHLPQISVNAETKPTSGASAAVK